MATLLNIYGNHRLDFNSGKQLIKDISKRLNVMINDGGYRDIGEKTSDIDNITFFTPYNNLEGECPLVYQLFKVSVLVRSSNRFCDFL